VKTSPSVQAFGGDPGVLILHRTTKHERWVQEGDIAISEYVENLEI
jgi:hypothetical protein